MATARLSTRPSAITRTLWDRKRRKAPTGWEERLVVVDVPARVASTTTAVAFCLEPHDLILSKLAANRERDWDFAKKALAAKLVDAAILLKRVDDLPVHFDLRTTIVASLRAIVARSCGDTDAAMGE